jgi:hypothetical protein
MFSWIKKCLAGSRKQWLLSSRSPARRTALRLEALEDRLVPTITHPPMPLLQVTAPTAMVAGHSIAVNVESLAPVKVANNYIWVENTAFNGPVTLTSSDNQLKPITIDLKNGQGTANIVLTFADTLTLTAAGEGETGTSHSIVVNPSSIAKSLEIVSPPRTVQVGNVYLIDVFALDAYGNIASANGDLTMTSNGGSTQTIYMQNGRTSGAGLYAWWLKPGKATLTFTFEGLTASETITVVS